LLRIAIQVGFPSVRHLKESLTFDEVQELVAFDTSHGLPDKRFAWVSAVQSKLISRSMAKHNLTNEMLFAVMCGKPKITKSQGYDPGLPEEVVWKMEQDQFR
jgi:hypothetical protein